MPKFRGRVSRDGQAILPRVGGNYFLFPGRRHGPPEWSGDFDTTRGQVLESGGCYRLTLEDGRFGEIVVDMMVVNGRGVTWVHFRGVSPFQEPRSLADAGQ